MNNRNNHAIMQSCNHAIMQSCNRRLSTKPSSLAKFISLFALGTLSFSANADLDPNLYKYQLNPSRITGGLLLNSNQYDAGELIPDRMSLSLPILEGQYNKPNSASMVKNSLSLGAQTFSTSGNISRTEFLEQWKKLLEAHKEYYSLAIVKYVQSGGNLSQEDQDRIKELGELITSNPLINPAEGESSVAIGYSSLSSGNHSLTLGVNSTTTGDAGISIGSTVNVTGTQSIAMGQNSTVSGNQSVAIGDNTSATADKAVVIGSSANVTGTQSIAMGDNSTVSGNQSVAIGDNTSATADKAVIIGSSANVTGTQSIAMGDNSTVSGEQSIAIGVGHQVSGNHSTTIGDPNVITGNDVFVAGNNNTVASNNVMVMGNNVSVSSGYDGAVILGDSSTVSTPVATAGIKIRETTYSFAGTNPSAVVSVGSAGAERQITNVAAGQISETSTDAINGSQLHAVITELNNLKMPNNNLEKKINKNRKRADAGIASTAAMTNIPQVMLPGASGIGVGVGNRGGQNALAVGYSAASDNAKHVVKFSAAVDSQSKTTFGAGYLYQW